ncbi:MAG: hypothetical protein K2Y37_14530 [Pirellulales bacterium]|nr:hypothetical protein [Pirellulales bacterium]
MKLLTKLFKRRTDRASTVECTALNDADVAELVRVYDSYGREHAITRQDWGDRVLLENLAAVRQDPDQLYEMIVGALHDGFVVEVLPFAEQLRELEPTTPRAATLLGVIYLQLQRLSDAEHTLAQQTRQHGDDAYVLTNLAKVYEERGETARADATLWRALELDPNQENGVAWFLSLARERRGDLGVEQALKALAALPGSWRARLWLARAALERQNSAEALRLYDEALELAGASLPAELLMQLSGDLGNHGYLVELLKRAAPRFVPEQHGLEVGINLIKANFDLGRFDHARALLNQLYALQRPDYQQALLYWDTQIASARARARAVEPQPAPTVATLRMACPLWLDQVTAAELLPRKDENAVLVAFLGGSANRGASAAAGPQLADTAGRITRALSLFLGEQFHLRTDGRSIVLQPFVHGHGGGLVLAAKPWPTELAAENARHDEPAADYVVVTHLDATAASPTLSLRLIRTIDATVLDSSETLVDLEWPEQAFTELARQMLDDLQHRAGVQSIDAAPWYRVPTDSNFSDYQLRLEQLLAATACQLDGARPDFLNGEREMLQGTLELCLREAANATPRFVLMGLVQRLQAINPQVVGEFREKVERLQREYPLAPSIQAVLDARLAAALA